MKLIFLTQQLTLDQNVYSGGEMGSRSNYDAWVRILGADNVTVINIPVKSSIYLKYFNYLAFRNMYSKKEETKIIEQINKTAWDILFFDGSWFGKISKLINKKGKIVAFLHNVERQYSSERLKHNPFTFIKYLSVLYNEKCLMKHTDYIIVLNNRDRDLVKKYYNKNIDLLLPVTLNDKYNNVHFETNTSEKKLLFVGSYFTPNVSGIKWFIKKVIPEVKCHLYIVGKGMEHLKKYESQKVTVMGTVEDIGAVYAMADAVVMPIFTGGGMKIKTAEALMYGKSILASREALTGYDMDNVDCVMECNTKEEFILAIDRLKANKKFQLKARMLYLQKYEQSVKVKKLADFICGRLNL